MHHQERPTIINDLATILNSRLTPITKNTQAASTIINRISKSKKKLKPWMPPKFCQFPNSPRTDELSFSKGLGQVSLQPVIDGLNQFKQAAIMSIKAQFNAMGPEGSKDSKLAIGAAEFLTQIYQAAKCFTNIVQNVNRLVDTYIQVTNKLTAEVIQTINRLEGEAFNLLQSLLKSSDLKTMISVELFDALNKVTNIYEIIGLMNDLQNQLNNAALAVDTLANSKERVMLHLNVNLTLLQNRIDSLLRYSALRDLLSMNLKNAQNSYMEDNFLEDLNLSEIKASSYNWSVTNTAGLYEYNLNDELNIIPKLNTLFKDYNEKLSNRLIIAAREEQGYIFVPDLEQGLISAGLDADLGTAVSLVLELSINNGDTIVRATAKGSQPLEGEKIIHRNSGIYFSKSKEKIEYNKVVQRSLTEWEIYLTETTLTPPSLGDYYYFKDPSTQQTWNFTISDGTKISEFPALWQVSEVTHNSVILKKMDESNLDAKNFITNYDYSKIYTIENLNSIPGVISPTTGLQTNSGEMRIFGKVKTSAGSYNYFVSDPDTGLPIPKGSYFETVDDFRVLHPLAPANPIDDEAAVSWSYTDGLKTYTLVQTIQYSIVLNRYVLPVGYEQDSPHSGDKIPCLNWSLSVYVTGEASIINKVRFSREFIAQPINSFFLKAHWGFIPHTFTTTKSIDLQNKTKEKAVTKNLFGS